MSDPIGICVLGHGVVGGGVRRILREQGGMILERTGLTFDLRHVVVRDLSKHAQHADLPLTTDAEKAIADPAVKVVVELMGGTGRAGELVEKALRAGKAVVTANKSLLAARGRELFALARRNKTCIAFEASCGGGIPIIQSMMQGLVANRIDDLVGIVNGTCNFILTKMTKNGWGYDQALAEAQRAGFAEADPTMDVSGRDAAQKLSLLSGLAFDVSVRESDIHVEGIDTLQEIDIRFARELGYVIKLLAIASRSGQNQQGNLSLRVHPTLVHKNDVLAEVSGSFNAISVYGSALGHALFYGRGAGQMPTASAVVADLVSVGMGIAQRLFDQVRIFAEGVPAARMLDFEQLQSRYYLRLTARDEPGVIARVTRILGEHGISLSAILQHETNDTNLVPVVITTHLAREGAVRSALEEIDRLGVVQPPTMRLRIIDPPKEFGTGN
ncbi:MAG: homoserine dehydrogenase [Phycisphaerales bacterium]|nr:homoserine dehydrogenase [Phycisphaerales bacterium]